MYDRSKYSLIFMSLIVFSILISSVMLVGSQASSTKHQIQEEQILKIEPHDHFTSSYINHSPIIVTSNADFENQSLPGNGTALNPYVIESYSITTTETCISIQNTDAYFVIRDCLLTGAGSSIGSSGIELSSVINGEIRNNTISDKENGVTIESSSDTMIINNTISYNFNNGVSCSSSHNIQTVNNTISENYIGVSVSGCLDITLSLNILVHNGFLIVQSLPNITPDNLVNGKLLGYFWNCTGEIIDGSQYGQIILFNCSGMTVQDGFFNRASIGITLVLSVYCNLINNTVSGNIYGMYFSYSSHNTMTNNTILYNNQCGVILTPVSDNNLFYLNRFSNKNLRYGNVYDYGNNQWNSTHVGNGWSDYSGSGVYNISGGAPSTTTSVDYYPFRYDAPDTTPPTINQPEDIEYVEGTTGHSITWITYDPLLYYYVVYQDSTDVMFRFWTNYWYGRTITANIDGLSVGVYSYTIEVHDTSWNSVSDIVLVTVLSMANTTTTTTTTSSTTGTDTSTDTGISDNLGDFTLIILGIGGVGAVLIIVTLLKFRKQS